MTVRDIIAGMKDLPAGSDASRKLAALLCEPDAPIDDIVRVLRCDAVLTTRVLRFCNSAHAGFAEPVTSVDQAVILLGHRQILRLASSLGIGSAMAPALPCYAIEAGELWRHCLTTAFIAEYLAGEDFAGAFAPPAAFTAALLHDLGKVAMHSAIAGSTESMVRSGVAGGLSRAEAEQAVLGFSHAEVGAALLECWRFPESLVEAVANHHRPAVAPRPRLSAVVHAADVVAHLMGSAPGWNGFALRVEPDLARLLWSDELKVGQVMIATHGMLDEVARFLEIP